MSEHLNWNGKPLRDLDYEESIEYEKEILKRVVSADRAGMSEGIINQLQMYLDIVKAHKAEQLQLYTMGLDGSAEKQSSDSFIIGEPEPEVDDDADE
jgi:hypothetical protein